jgi:molybdopterin synthase sulfur carrier subunit
LRVELKEGTTVRDLLDYLAITRRRLKPAVFDESGQVREYSDPYEEQEKHRFMKLDKTPREGDEVAILPPVAGGFNFIHDVFI